MEDIVQRNLFVNMERADLHRIPDYSPPAGFHLRWYQPDDERSWVAIHRLAEKYVDVSLADFRRVFEDDFEALGRRQCYLCGPQSVPIGTATAWYEPDFHGRPFGRIHWVAVVPEYQGRGLSKPLLSAVMKRMVELGHERVYLRTSTARIPAIGLYQRFGFQPSLRTRQDRELWQELNPRLPRPFPL